MGCVSSSLLNQDEEFSQIGGFSHHIVSLTSTTYGLLSLDPLPPPSVFSTTTVPPTPEPPPPRRTLGSLFPTETINTWDLMSGLDPDHSSSFRNFGNNENVSPNVGKVLDSFLEGFEKMCPPNGENKVVVYTTSLRGVRKTFEDCNAVRSAIQGLGIYLCERDISMDRGFKEELRELLNGKELIPPRLFVKGRYIGGVEEVMAMVEEEGMLGKLFSGLPKSRGGCAHACEGCGGVGFLPCFTCHGSCKMVSSEQKGKQSDVVLRCSECNENGLVLCPICS